MERLFNLLPPFHYFFAENGSIYTIDFDKLFYDEVAKIRKNVIDEKSKDCFNIDQEWALDLLKNDGVYNENLPFQDVHYGSEYTFDNS